MTLDGLELLTHWKSIVTAERLIPASRLDIVQEQTRYIDERIAALGGVVSEQMVNVGGEV